ncbi:ABC transporter permease [Bacteroides gallinaceum]|uniref:ABC transporter permease n=1 Tax=Bacteroides gallinaceum TaxID=1462571 RepID=A0ABT7X4U9_9BACE|nr:FtsX-like permease family protein [Bacteroides gallinaceum]MDN0049082.1 ABC transporter permease [Bacteroides gallinaceum]MDN0065214.1 ABC transporter permease [Bacteroides gallinaceum]
MNTLARNFSHTFRRFLTASVLNIIGLAIAFASFFVIMTQVDYDLNFNKGYKDYQNIYRLEIKPNEEWGWQLWTPRPIAELIGTASPHIQASAITGWVNDNDYEVNGNLFNEPMMTGFGDFMNVFQPEMVTGSTDALEKKDNVLIPVSMAMRMFGSTDVVGKMLFRGKQSDNKPVTIGGVYKDFPENSQIGNYIFMPFDPDIDKNNWGNWNYTCYYRLDNPANVSEVEKLAFQKLMKIAPEELQEGLQEEKDNADFFHLIPLSEVHFSKIGNKSASSRTTVYLLICVSFLIVIVAAINFMNFSLAETPMRLKSINTQKVLGAKTSSLRGGLIAESVLISLIAFAVSLVLLLAVRNSGIQDLVTADLSLGKHLPLLAATFGISILIGVLAGLYPSFYVTSFPPALVLKGSFGLSPKGRKLRTALVCFQFFVAFMLIIAIGIMYTQSRYIRTSEYGYDKDDIVVGDVTQDARNQKDAVVSELSRISGVEGVAFSQFVLNSQDTYMSWGRGEGDKNINFACFPVDEHYLDVMGIRITEGRNFKPSDNGVYIFNEAARKKYPWMAVDMPATPGDWNVVGFCENIRFSTFRNNDIAEPMAFIYVSKAKLWSYENIVNVRISAGTDKVAVIRSLQKAMEKFTPGHDFNFRFMDQVLDNAYRNELRFTRQILLFSLLAIVISMIGVFGLTMFESEYRRKEIGIRKIFGSTTGEILRMFNKRYLYILIGCFIVAAPFGWWIGQHWLEGFAERTPIRAWIFLASFLLVTAITMITVTVQSWKNANENPANSIKTE